MKNIGKLLVIFLAITLTFSMTACGGNGAGGGGGSSSGTVVNPPAAPSPTSTSFESTDADGNIYMLEITKASVSKAVYSPKNGDTYILTIVTSAGEIKISRGTVTVNGSDFTLTPTGSTEAEAFTVTTSGENMTAIIGTIKTEDNSTVEAPAKLTAVPVKTFSTYELRANRWGGPGEGTGEGWGGDDLKLSDFTSVKPEKGYVLKFIISGTTDKTTGKYLSMQVWSRASDWSFAKVLGTGAIEAVSGTFYERLEIRVDDDPYTDPNADSYLGIGVPLWGKDADGNYQYDVDDSLPANIATGTVMATIRDFKIRLVGIEITY